jgi:hypothetical protein
MGDLEMNLIRLELLECWNHQMLLKIGAGCESILGEAVDLFLVEAMLIYY